MNCQNTNGRVNIITPDTQTLFSMTDQIPINKCSDYRNALNGSWSDTQLSKTFFSQENMNHLQAELQKGVYNKSNGNIKIGPQSCDELKTIMRAIYLQNAKNLPHNIPQQIKDLNKCVLDYSINQVYNEAIGYINYCKDVSTLPTPLAHPAMVDINDKQLILKHFID